MPHWLSSTDLSMSIRTPAPPHPVVISKGKDKNRCDIKILEMAVRFVSLADSMLGNTAYKIRTEQPRP